jgi:ABC-type polysaccharide/polyol phosphate export permease
VEGLRHKSVRLVADGHVGAERGPTNRAKQLEMSQTTTSDQRPAMADIVEGILAWRVWVRFGWYDLVARYRRSWVGPLWLAISTLIFVFSMGIVFSFLFNMSMSEYLPYVAFGTVVWTYLNTVACDGVSTFVEAEGYIRQVKRPLSIYVCRVAWRNTIMLANQMVAALAVAIMFGRLSIALLPLAVLGLVFLIANSVWVIVLVGVLGTRFRDVLPIIQNILQVLFFITPVIWLPSQIGDRLYIAEFNPLYHLIELVRAPFLGTVPPFRSYVIIAVVTVMGFLVAALFYQRFRDRVVYWL